MKDILRFLLTFVVFPAFFGIIGHFLVRGIINLMRTKNYYGKHVDRALAFGFVEKDLEIRPGMTLHYAESPMGTVQSADRPRLPLLLMPGQGCNWHDYGPVLVKLCRNFHVIAVDLHGHGKSTWNPADYHANRIADDIALFIEQVFREPIILAGHSSGGLIAACVAERHPEQTRGLIFEDPPFFSTEPHRKEKTFSWIDSFSIIRDFCAQDEEADYLCYYMPRAYWRVLFGRFWNLISDNIIRQRRLRPQSIPVIRYLSPQINRIWESISHPFDLRFARGFIDDSFFRDFDQADTLSKIRCPSVFIKATTRWDKQTGILLAALDEEDCARVHQLLPMNELIHVRSGHDVHFERPQPYLKAIEAFAEKLQETAV